MKEMICIGCPLGCQLQVEMQGDRITVSGNTCEKGKSYAVKEMTHPSRTVTSTVAVIDGMIPRVSVKTKFEIGKEKIFSCMEEIHRVQVQAPVHIGDVVIKNCAGTGIDIVATQNVEEWRKDYGCSGGTSGIADHCGSKG